MIQREHRDSAVWPRNRWGGKRRRRRRRRKPLLRPSSIIRTRSVFGPGLNFKYTAYAKSFCSRKEKHPKGFRHAQQSTPNERTHVGGGICWQKSDKDRKVSVEDKTRSSSIEAVQPIDLCLVAAIKSILLSDNTLHLISGRRTPPETLHSWEAERKTHTERERKAKVQFNRFTARQNWVSCGRLTKTAPSRSLCARSFTPVSIDKSAVADLSQSRLSPPLPADVWARRSGISKHGRSLLMTGCGAAKACAKPSRAAVG